MSIRNPHYKFTYINDPNQLKLLESIIPQNTELLRTFYDEINVKTADNTYVPIIDYLFELTKRTAPHAVLPTYHRVIDENHDPRVIPKQFKTVEQFTQALLMYDSLNTFCQILNGDEPVSPPALEFTTFKRDINSYTDKKTNIQITWIFAISVIMAATTIAAVTSWAATLVVDTIWLRTLLSILPWTVPTYLTLDSIRIFKKQKQMPQHNLPQSLIDDLKTLYLIDNQQPMFLYEMLDTEASTHNTLVFNKPNNARHAGLYHKPAFHQALMNYIDNQAPTDEYLAQIVNTIQTISRRQFDLDVQAEEAKLYAAAGNPVKSPVYLSMTHTAQQLRNEINTNQKELDTLLTQNSHIIEKSSESKEHSFENHDIW